MIGRNPALTMFWITVTSVVMRVIRDDTAKWSRFENAYCCIFSYSAFRISAPQPYVARAAKCAYKIPVTSAKSAQIPIWIPLR